MIPGVWGPAPIQDRVETADLVEIGLTATVSNKAWFDDASQSTRDDEWMDWGAAPLPELPEVTQSVELEFNAYAEEGDSLATWTINGRSWGDHEVIEVQGNTPSQITLRDLSGRPHPFHLHGQFFQVLSRNGNPPQYPGLLDTVQMSGDDEVVIQTRFDNPGLWMAHCHILEHAEQGMMTQISVSE